MIAASMNSEELMRELFYAYSAQNEEMLRLQLGDLISKGLLVIERTIPTLVKCMDSDQIELRYAIKLVLKDKEYIEKLEKENAELKDKLTRIAYSIKGIE